MINGELVSQRTRNELLYKVYMWMTIGLGLTATISYFIGNSPTFLAYLFKNPGLIFVLLLIEFGLVAGLSFFLNRMSFVAAAFTFIAYSILNGITLSSIFLVYTQASIAIIFVVAAGMFAAMALYGYLTKADLTGMGSFLFMGLIGLMIALLINIFLRSPAFDFVISAFGVIIFALLTAYDVQQIKIMSQRLIASGEDMAKISILGALKLYLDFINLFLYLLRFLGHKKDQ